jgi:dihydrolipoamide dehydrogenase
VLLIALVLILINVSDVGSYLTFDYLKSSKGQILEFYSQNQVLTLLAYFFIYIAVTALSIPGAAVLTLAGGAVFGFLVGTLVVSFASTIGASLAFLISRFLLQDYVQHSFSSKIKVINRGIEKQGALYLLTLRLVPIVPFFVINLAMGLTKMKLVTFFVVSQVGMLLGTMVYVNAGTQLGQLNSLSGIMSPGLIFSFMLLGVFPLLAKRITTWIDTRRIYTNYQKPSRFDYNVIVIGAGAGGLVSSYIAAAVKAKVALIEKSAMGGDCLNTGCVPSKAILKSANVVALAKKANDYGLDAIDISFDFSKVMKRVKRVIKTIEPHDSVERYERLGVDCIHGNAVIKSPYSVEVNGQTLTSKAIIIATGASPVVPNIKGLEDVHYRTSETIWDLNEMPKRLLVMGGGPIGVELAQAFSRLGSTVTIVEMNTQILSKEDQRVAELVKDSLESDGVEVLTGYKGIEFKSSHEAQFLSCESEHGMKDIPFDLVLLAMGRRPNVKGFGLEELGVSISAQGAIDVDSFLRTNIPNIYVCGDVLGAYQFTHVAAHEAWYASVNALFSPFKSFQVDYSIIPAVTYCDPEVARVGLNEKEAIELGVLYEVTTYEIDDLDRAIADEEARGFVKVLTPPGKDQILGVTIVGSRAGDLMAEFVLAMKYKLGLNKILSTIHAYPTFSEANKYAAGQWKRSHAPKTLLNWVEKFHSTRRG